MILSESKRVILNTLVSYGRSIVTCPINLFSARWILDGLGETDYGIYNVVGGVVFFIGFISSVLSGAASRFYAFSIGYGKTVSKEKAHEDLCGWFNASLSIHIFLPILLLMCYPIFSYVVCHWLVIPAERIDASLWVLRFTLLTSFFSFLNVPFVAMFSAHQLIVELTLYTMATSIFQFLIAAWIPYYAGDRLIAYAFAIFLVNCLILLTQNIRARFIFDSVRIRCKQLFDVRRMKELMAFVIWRMISGAAYVVRGQGASILLNVYFGPQTNTAYSIGNQISGQAGSLSQSLINALMPVTSTSVGSGDCAHTVELAYRSCKFATLLTLLFGIPLILEIDEVLSLWLKRPPAQSAVFCVCAIVAFVIDKFTVGQYLSIMANGRIRGWQVLTAASYVGTLLIAWGLVFCGVNAYAVGYAYLIVSIVISAGNIYFARRLAGIGVKRWFYDVVLKVVPAMFFSVFFGFCCTMVMPKSFLRLCLTTSVSIGILLGIAWRLSLSDTERQYVRGATRSLFSRLGLKK